MQTIGSMMPTGPQDDLVHRGARRQSTRYPVHGEVSVTSPIQAEGFLFNASAGGLRLALDHPVELGAQLELQVRLAGYRSSSERAEVVWTREQPDGWLVGLRFLT
ncbi:MAG: PilZ domain-containing protein [Sandaracinaceae bacterium]|nr:PilZ domain-containing protein [Sandaracinaceae bacterium]